jgi:ELWxxDGT repeat protein
MFAAEAPSGNRSLYLSDGTTSSTLKMAEIGDVTHITPFSSGAIMTAATASVGRELFRSDGTVSGSGLVKDILTGTPSSNPRVFSTAAIENAWDRQLRFAKVGSRYLFGASDATRGFELWRTAGTAGSTIVVRDFLTDTASGLKDIVGHTDSYALVVANDALQGPSLWATDGSPAGTRFLMRERGNNLSQETGIARIGANGLLFTQDQGNSLWFTDGTQQGTRLVRNFPSCATGAAFRHIESLTGFPDLGYALFSGCTAVLGHELWRSDGTTEGTSLVRNIMVGSASSKPKNFYRSGSTVYFAAESASIGTELWRTDGTTAGTRLVADVRPGPESSDPIWFKRFGNRVVFAAEIDGSDRKFLHSTTGTTAGTRRIGDVVVRTPMVNIGTKLVFGGYLLGLFTGEELIGTGGTEATTGLVADIYPGPGASMPRGLTAVQVAQTGFATPAACPVD